MAQSSRSFRKFAACVLVLCCLGGGAWYVLSEEGKSPVEAARNLVRNLTGETSENGASSAASSGADTSGTTAGSSKEENTPRQVGAALNTGGRPVPLDPQAELLARVDRAMGAAVPAAPDGDSASGRVTDQPPQTDAGRRDSVVTPRFVSDMAGWLAANYIPSHHEGRSGRSSVTLVQVNARYSNSGTLRSVERDPLKSRSSILNYVFTPGMLEVLYRMYAPSFLEEMEHSAREARRGHPLSDAQVADMFGVYADKFRRLAASLDAAAMTDLPVLAEAIHREAEHEAEANDNFARAYMALSAARESGNRDEVAIQSRRMAESTRVAGMYAERQERARNDMAYAIRRHVEGHALSSSELLFLGEWLSRRGCSAEATRAAADVCRRLAEQMSSRADDILHEREIAPAAAAQDGKTAPAAAASSSESTAPEPASATDSGAAAAESSVVPAASSGDAKTVSDGEKTAAGSAPSDASSVPASAEKSGTPEAGKGAAPTGETAASGKTTSSAKASYPEVTGTLNRETPAQAPSSAADGPAFPPASADAPADSVKKAQPASPAAADRQVAPAATPAPANPAETQASAPVQGTNSAPVQSAL